jgi:type IV pilus assembly protein PilC
MALYNYECLTRQGETVRGQISSESQAAALARLRNMGLLVTGLVEEQSRKKSSFLSNEKKVTLGDLSIFSRQLASMVKAGIPVTRALYTLSSQTKNRTLGRALETIAQNVEGGMNLTDAFAAYPGIFPDLFVSMIRSGELGGILDDALLRLSVQLQKDKALRDSIKSATFYPRMVMGFAIIMMIAMLLFLVPVFQGFIPENTPVPGVTLFIFNISHSLRTRWYIWLLVIAAIIGGFVAFTKSKGSKIIWEKTKFKLPAFGRLLHMSVIARFSRTLATLIEGGIPVVQALESAGPTSGSLLLANAVVEACRKITEGKNISGPLEDSGLFPPMVIQMIAVGEESGSLSSLLDKVAEFYEDEVATVSKGLTSLIEPIMLIVVGLLVGGMLVSLYLPIFTAVSASGGA